MLRPYFGRTRQFHALAGVRATLGIRAEDPARRWERRAPLTPAACATLVSKGVQVLVQPCEKRVFADAAYEEVSCVPCIAEEERAERASRLEHGSSDRKSVV